jgi:alanine-synthesizing transaminase
MYFSSRTPDDLSLNPIARAAEKASGLKILDLTLSNPTQCGFNYPKELLNTLSDPSGFVYDPHSSGHPHARQALAKYLAVQGQKTEVENIILTASTSEAYSYLFKLLADPGDSFLVPTPGYPLLDHLVRLDGIRAIPYPFKFIPGWPVDTDALEAGLEPRTRGIIAINPHNPTGCFLSQADQTFLFELCKKRQIAFIVDEVFADYAYSKAPFPRAADPGVLTFRLGGLSKSLGLPQLKLSWIVLEGPPQLVKECRERLELIADTYLSVNTPVQLGLGKILLTAPAIQKQILQRLLDNRSFLNRLFKDSETRVRVWPADGGWYALLEVLHPPFSEEELVISLLQKHHVLVQPGSFYDFPSGCFLVLSLLPEKAVFEEGVQRLKAQLSEF